MTTPQLILIAGPYRSGTDGDPARIAANLARLEAASLPIYRAGHIPMIGEWVALPILREAEAEVKAEAEAEAEAKAEAAGVDPNGADVMYETAARLLQHCDGVLRLPGESSGADNDVRIARERGIPVYTAIDQLPGFVG